MNWQILLMMCAGLPLWLFGSIVCAASGGYVYNNFCVENKKGVLIWILVGIFGVLFVIAGVAMVLQSTSNRSFLPGATGRWLFPVVIGLLAGLGNFLATMLIPMIGMLKHSTVKESEST